MRTALRYRETKNSAGSLGRKKSIVFAIQLLFLALFLYALHTILLIKLWKGENVYGENQGGDAHGSERNSFNYDHTKRDPIFSACKSQKDKLQNLKKSNLAICFAGSLKEFDLSGPSIIRHVLEYYHPAISFFSIPLDGYTHKLSLLLRSPNASIAVNIRPPLSAEVNIKGKLLNPNGYLVELQDLFEYFELLEKCSEFISDYENENDEKIEWIMHVRTDSYWNNHPPPLSSLSPKSLSLPPSPSFTKSESESMEMNDRLFIGKANITKHVLKRYTMLKRLISMRHVSMHSAWMMSEQLNIQKLTVRRLHFPFCILSRPTKREISGKVHRRIANLKNNVSLNGLDCRPCAPHRTEPQNTTERLSKPTFRNAWGTEVDVQLCNSSMDVPWTGIRERFYDLTLDEPTAQVRKHLRTRKYWSCLKENLVLRLRAQAYTGPPASVLCTLGMWGDHRRLGYPSLNWNVLPRGFREGCIVYSFGLGTNLAFESSALGSFRCEMHGFDCKQSKNLPKIENHNLTAVFRRHNLCLGWVPTNSSALLFAFNSSSAYLKNPIVQKSKTLEFIMKMLSHRVVDLVKIDVGESIYDLLIDGLDSVDKPLPVCQLLISLPSKKIKNNDVARHRVFAALEKKGMYLTKCFGNRANQKCHFLSSHVCSI